MHRVAVVIGSNRPNRICAAIATWVTQCAQVNSSLEYSLLDLAEIDLPFLDEPMMPASGNYQHEHTRAWSHLVSSYAAFVFVFPQYNWGYPAVLKNALDFLYVEWRDKPAGIVTYGTRGGNRAATQLRSVLQGLHMRPAETTVELSIAKTDVDELGQLIDIDLTLMPFMPRVRQLDLELTDALEDQQTV